MFVKPICVIYIVPHVNNKFAIMGDLFLVSRTTLARYYNISLDRRNVHDLQPKFQ